MADRNKQNVWAVRWGTHYLSKFVPFGGGKFTWTEDRHMALTWTRESARIAAREAGQGIPVDIG